MSLKIWKACSFCVVNGKPISSSRRLVDSKLQMVECRPRCLQVPFAHQTFLLLTQKNFVSDVHLSKLQCFAEFPQNLFHFASSLETLKISSRESLFEYYRSAQQPFFQSMRGFFFLKKNISNFQKKIRLEFSLKKKTFFTSHLLPKFSSDLWTFVFNCRFDLPDYSIIKRGENRHSFWIWSEPWYRSLWHELTCCNTGQSKLASAGCLFGWLLTSLLKSTRPEKIFNNDVFLHLWKNHRSFQNPQWLLGAFFGQFPKVLHFDWQSNNLCKFLSILDPETNFKNFLLQVTCAISYGWYRLAL